MSKGKDQPDAASETEFADRAGVLFRQSVDEMDAAAQSRLRQARQAAISDLSSNKPRLGNWTPWVPAAGVAAAAAVAVVMWNTSRQIDPDMTLTPLAEVSDFEILLDGDSLEMLEDLEFYAWLESASLSEPDVG